MRRLKVKKNKFNLVPVLTLRISLGFATFNLAALRLVPLVQLLGVRLLTISEA